MGDFSAAVSQPRLLHDQVDCGSDLFPDRPHRQIHPRHQHHRFQAAQHIARCIGVPGGKRTVMAGVHRLQHIQRLTATHLADHDSVRPHPQRVPNQVTHGHGAFSLNIGRPGLQRHDMFLTQLQFGGVFNRNDPVLGRNKGRQYVQRRGLA